MNTGAMTPREQKLAQLPYVALLPYEDKKYALRLIQKGIDETLLHFWYNVKILVAYKDLPASVLDNDLKRMRTTYPQFADDIESWTK
jgi:hypothetical protein